MSITSLGSPDETLGKAHGVAGARQRFAGRVHSLAHQPDEDADVDTSDDGADRDA